MEMLQMQPKKEIVIEFIKNDNYEKRNWFAIFCCWWKVIADK